MPHTHDARTRRLNRLVAGPVALVLLAGQSLAAVDTQFIDPDLRRVLGPSSLLASIQPSSVSFCDLAAKKQPAGRTGQPSNRARDAEAARTLNTANGLLQRGLFDLAVPEYEKFLEAAPDHASAPIAHYGLAVCLQRLGRGEDALAHLDPLTEQTDFQFAAEVDLLIGTCRLSRGEYAEAAIALRRMLRGFPQHASAADAGMMLVESLSRAGEHEQAAREARGFAQAFPDSPLRERTDLFLAVAEMNAGRDEPAQRVLEQSLERFPQGALADQATLLLAQCRHRRGLLGEAADAYEVIAQRVRGPIAADALLGLGQIALAEGRLDDAAMSLDTLLRNHPDSACVQAASLARARVSLEQGDTAAARGRLEALEASGPREMKDDAAYWLAKCDLRDGNAEAAADRLRAAARRYDESDLAAEIMYDTAIATLRAGDDAAAGDALAAFREAYPRHTLAGDALATQAGVLHRLGEHEASRALCEQFLRESAGSARTAEIEFLAAENRYLAGDYARAERAYRQFVEKHEAGGADSAGEESGDGRAAAEAVGRLEAARFRLAMSVYRQDKLGDAEALLEQVAGMTPLRMEFAGALLALGDARFQRGAWAEAEEVLTRYLDLGPSVASRDDALMKVGLSRARQGEHQDAIVAFKEIIVAHEDSVHALQARFECGQSMLALGQDANAKAMMEEVLAAGRESRFAPHALMNLGTIARREGRNEDAARLLSEAGRLGGGELAAEAELQRGEALLGSGQYETAAGVFAEFIENNADHPQAAAARARLVIALARAGEHEQAVAAHTALGRRASTLDAPTRHAMLYEVAWAQRTLGRADAAETILRSLMADSPEPALLSHVLLALGGLRADAGQAEEAQELFRGALAAARSAQQGEVVEQASYRLGACGLELERFEDAALALEPFVAEFRESDLRASALLLRGEALLRASRVQQAAESFQAVIDEHEESEHVLPALLRLGEATAILQLWSRSEAAFAGWLEREPTDEQGGELWFQARFGLGWARENQGRFDEAMSEYSRVVEGHEGATAARAQFQIGQCLFAQGKHEDAARELLKVDILYAYPEWSAAALYEAGRCLLAAGRTAEAREQFEAVRTRFGDTQWANLAAQRLADATPERVPGR